MNLAGRKAFTIEGQRLLAHELTHVVQQRAAGRPLVYNQLMAFVNLLYAGVFTDLSAYHPDFSKGLEMPEYLSEVTDTYLNLISLALHYDLKKYLEDNILNIRRLDMHALIREQRSMQDAKSESITRPDRAYAGQSRKVNTILHLQRTIGNQAAQPLLQRNSEGPRPTTPRPPHGIRPA